MPNISRIIHDLLFADASQSLCARAWSKRDARFWRAWVAVFGKRHCEASWRWHNE